MFENPLIVILQCRLKFMSNTKEIVQCWIPSQIGVKGNDKADLDSKSVQEMFIDDGVKIPSTDLKIKINYFTINNGDLAGSAQYTRSSL